VTDVEEVPTLEATGRVLARAQRSTMDVPPMDNSAMDGYAIRLADLKDRPLRVAQKIMAGSVGKALEPGTAARIFTGAPIPEGADAVVMQEFCEADGDSVRDKKTPARGEWIRKAARFFRPESASSRRTPALPLPSASRPCRCAGK
jgi:molybdopterin molybdotransferase